MNKTATFLDFKEILEPVIEADDWQCICHLPISGIVADSRLVKNGEVFALLALAPLAPDVAQAYIASVNSVAVLSEFDPKALGLADTPMPVVHVPRLRQVLGDLVATFLQGQEPCPLPRVVAVTGTNGKTTISQLTAQLCELAKLPAATMGTAGNGRVGQLTVSTHTTSDVITTQRFLYDMARSGVAVVALEASSHGLDQQRLQGVPVTVAVFSNLSRDHLDYHQSMDEYGKAKERLFDKAFFPGLQTAIINNDDAFGSGLACTLMDRGLRVWTVSLTNHEADFFASDIRPSLMGVDFVLQSPFGSLELHSPLLGQFNVANVLASIAGFLALGTDAQASFGLLPALLPKLTGARGRMERIHTAQNAPTVIVDYAHTPDALEKALVSLRTHAMGKVWAVFGSGGDRDKGKRPLMARAGLALADKVVLTSDNPRSEDPQAILADMQVGMDAADHAKIHIEPDRREAIAYALRHASYADIVLVAGKGHETYQEIRGVRYEFDDAAQIRQLLNACTTSHISHET